ncbi:hypothetical protein [Pasteurella canis]|uniref:hypothetical protein n=3 Tax=Pasteurella canis TaxID=753 RepID=UPI000DA034EB|nr:hypothetical protein [Pasteurella canis]SPY38466.1 Uncharacterised protein [Pasteurella canis]
MKKSLLVVLMSMVLAACGSSGGKSWVSNGGLINPPVDEPILIDIVPNPDVAAVGYVDDGLKGKVIKIKSEFLSKDFGLEFDASNLPEGVMTKKVNGNVVRMLNLPYSVLAWRQPSAYTEGEEFYDSKELLSGVGKFTIKDNYPASKATYHGYSANPNAVGKMLLNMDFASTTVSGKLYERKNKEGEGLPDITLKETSNYAEDAGVGALLGETDYKPMGVDNNLRYVVTFAGPSADEAIGFVMAMGETSAPPLIYEAFGGKRDLPSPPLDP